MLQCHYIAKITENISVTVLSYNKLIKKIKKIKY